MFPKKPKKPGLAVEIAVGKPKGRPEMDAPDPFDAAPKPEHEAAESPEYEEAEESGASLLSDVTKPLVEMGMEEADAKATVAQIFRAVADCLSAKDEAEGGVAEHDAGGADFEGSEEK